jgi:pyruvate-formate lyase-activating enzyme
MPTVMLTTHCPNRCDWCFARTRMEDYLSRGIREMSWEDFLAVADFYERSRLHHMILVGGEPGLHTRFVDILNVLGEKGFSAHVATTGILPERVVDGIAGETLPRLRFGVNSTSYFEYGRDKRERVDHFLRRLGRMANLCYTITRRDLDGKNMEPILDRLAMILQFSLIRHIQFQIAVPGERNRFYVPFDRYRDLAELIRCWFTVLKKHGISCALDCHCMSACAIPDDLKNTGLFETRCDRFMIDIGPGREIWPCFPLSRQSGSLDRFGTRDEIGDYFRSVNGPQEILYDESCEGCTEREAGTCHGGCRGFEHVRRRETQQEKVQPVESLSGRSKAAQP